MRVSSIYLLIGAVSEYIPISEVKNNQFIKKGTMGLGFNAFENFVETEDDGLIRFTPAEKSEEETDARGKKNKVAKRGIEEGRD